MSTQSQLMCHLGQRSKQRCGPHVHSPLQTLDELDATSMRVPGKSVKISWMMLSRVGVQYLNASYGWWTVCPTHRKEYLDAWQVGKACCHPVHKVQDHLPPAAEHMVSMLMSIKILQTEGLVVPISGKLCQSCKNMYDQRYGGKQSENVVVFLPRAAGIPPPCDALTIPSPFCNPEQQHLPQPSQPCPPQSPPPMVSSHLITSGFLMHGELNKTKAATKQPKRSKNLNSRRSTTTLGSATASGPVQPPQPCSPPPAEPDVPMWQVLGLQPAQNTQHSTSAVTIPEATNEQALELPVAEGRCASPAESDNSFTRITIKMEVEDSGPRQAVEPVSEQVLESVDDPEEQVVEPDEEEAERVEEDRPGTAMSILSNDSDDDPTWAPEPDQLKKSDKNLARKSEAATLKSLEKLFEKNAAKRKKMKEKAEKKEKEKKKRGRKKKTKEEKKAEKKNKKKEEEKQRIRLEPPKRTFIEKSEVSSNQLVPPKTDESYDFKFLCALCQISFFRESAYKHHMASNAAFHRQLEEKAKSKKDGAQLPNTCVECSVSFKDRVSYQRHMAEEHSSGEHPFFCQICNVYLKCEAAFKSHNSKLHLERRAKMFYCRQCDETFSCKLRHTDHIATHRTWSDDDQGLQCKVCGKVFSKTQIMGYQKHLSTHDEEVDVVCTCRSCRLKNVVDDDKNEATSRGRKRKRETRQSSSTASTPSPKKTAKASDLKPLNRSNLFAKMQNIFNSSRSDDNDEEEEIENLESEFLTPFACGVCAQTFSSVTKLEEHVNKSHKEDSRSDVEKATVTSSKANEIKKSKIDFSGDIFDEITNDFVTEVENENVDKNVATIKTTVKSSTELSRRLVDSSKVVIIKPTEKNWQECAARNWAAEFGYGNTKNVEKNKRSLNLISMMKTNFFNDDHEKDVERDENETDKVFRSRGLKGVEFIRASPGKDPRTLSASSLRSRKRMESLLQRARDFMLSRDRDKEEQRVIDEKEAENEKSVGKDYPDPELVETFIVPVVEARAEKEAENVNEKDESATENSSPATRRSKREKAKPVKEPEVEHRLKEAKPAADVVEERKSARIKKHVTFSNPPTSDDRQVEAEKPVRSRRHKPEEPRQVPEVEIESSVVEPAIVETPVTTAEEKTFTQNQLEATATDVEAASNVENNCIDVPVNNGEVLEEIIFEELPTEEEVEEEDDDEDVDDDDEEFSDFECILDVDEDSDGLLIPLENGWVCEKNWSSRTGSYSTHFWSPDGRRHASLTVIQFYAEKKKLNLNMAIFERALKNNPPRKSDKSNPQPVKRKKMTEARTTRSKTQSGH